MNNPIQRFILDLYYYPDRVEEILELLKKTKGFERGENLLPLLQRLDLELEGIAKATNLAATGMALLAGAIYLCSSSDSDSQQSYTEVVGRVMFMFLNFLLLQVNDLSHEVKIRLRVLDAQIEKTN